MYKIIITLITCLILSACKLDYVFNADGSTYGGGSGGGGGGGSTITINSINGGVSLNAGTVTDCTMDASGDLYTTTTASGNSETAVMSQFTSTDGSCTGTETLLITTTITYSDYGDVTLPWNGTPPMLQDGSGSMPANVTATKLFVEYTSVTDHNPVDLFFPVPQGTTLSMVMFIDDTGVSNVNYMGDDAAGVDAQLFANVMMDITPYF
jgi:hypothetical protein